MTSDELLAICQKHFPDLTWKIDYYEGEPEGAMADLGAKGVIFIQLYPNGAIANFGRGSLTIRSDNKTGSKPDTALAQLKQRMRAYASEILDLLGDEQ